MLISLEPAIAVSAIDARILEKIISYGTIALVISKEETKEIIKIFKSLEHSGLLLRGVTKTIENELNEQRGGYLVYHLMFF